VFMGSLYCASIDCLHMDRLAMPEALRWISLMCLESVETPSGHYSYDSLGIPFRFLPSASEMIRGVAEMKPIGLMNPKSGNEGMVRIVRRHQGLIPCLKKLLLAVTEILLGIRFSIPGSKMPASLDLMEVCLPLYKAKLL
jgi:hypothetical protein